MKASQKFIWVSSFNFHRGHPDAEADHFHNLLCESALLRREQLAGLMKIIQFTCSFARNISSPLSYAAVGLRRGRCRDAVGKTGCLAATACLFRDAGVFFDGGRSE